MKINTLLSFVVGLASVASGAIVTSNGKTVPDSLAKYFDCLNSDKDCKLGQTRTCMVNFNDCREKMTKSYLTQRGHVLGNLTPKEYCSIHEEVCQMINSYNVVITPSGKTVPNSLLKYLKCGNNDRNCKLNQERTCKYFYEDCRTEMTTNYLTQRHHNLEGLTPKNYCSIHEEVCNMISTYNDIKVSSGATIPTSLLKYFDCPTKDSMCQDGQVRTCMVNYNDCRANMTKRYLTKKHHILGNLTPKQYCSIHEEACQFIKSFDPPVTDEEVNDLGRYFTCNKTDYDCKTSKLDTCKAVLEKCWNNYPYQTCNQLSITCSKILIA
ncbi:hypothetical protein H8356DRAFT_1654255 [Neocallimastix lanati (nom. inval.)]|jgi:hypothetical protein|uniref:Uncharacterized protein n=1 Tax=Neocallimastix californiae TaxID=1754190 RepID=A0A1Y2AY60_9FUNG|nr:hypothetical protein H8356DRAFT_1654255 [Neocallimastix sp. JGI-2020a]ORY27519.1 hypothetical protein LY90DRAFT_95436 [Neocallimastix californiae]|eukprot:ORY27519.1 hypothetical protein LY90DRAFT_95436 [Neocallimastix californiae]